MTPIEDPAAAVAAGLCVTARSLGAKTARHPGPCGWCDWPLPALSRMVAEFNAWADPERGRRPFEAQAFAGLPAAEQARRVAGAQSVEPMAPDPAAAADGEEALPWI